MLWVLVGTYPLNRDTHKETLRKKRETQEKIAKTRLMQEIDNDNPYQSIVPVLPGQQPYSVQFEPLAHIRLSRSTYKVTTFIEFKPYIDSFKNFYQYLQLFLEDMADPKKVSGFSFLMSRHLDPPRGRNRFNDKYIVTAHACEKPHEELCATPEQRYGGGRDLGKPECLRQMQIICRAKLQFSAIVNATDYIKTAFNQTAEEFLSVIDHLETEAEEEDPEIRKRHNDKVQKELIIAYTRVSKEEIEVLDDIIKQVADKYPDLNRRIISRVKRFGIMSWIMGWGVYSNWRQIKSIKKNIRKLYLQNVLQERQIQDLAHHLNLTATRVQIHDKMLYNIQVRLSKIDHSIKIMQDMIQFNWLANNMILDAHVVINRLITGLIVLKNNVERIYRYLNVIASKEINPVMIPPPPLREMLAEVKEEMKQNPRLELPYDPQREIYKFYEVIKITPIVIEDVLSLVLTIPLIDRSLQMNVYKVHNLPALQAKLGIAAEYILEGDYLAVDQHGLYVALPDAREMQICLTSQGGLCVMNQALHPVETVEWCVYALFIQNEDRIKRDCTMNFKARKANVAQSIGGYLWAVSSLVGEKDSS